MAATQAAEWMLACDGSSRDVTFTPTTKEAAVAFLTSLLSGYNLTSAYDSNGIEKSQQLQSDAPFNGIGGYIHIVLADGGDIIPHLQVFIDHDRETDKYDVEITFFPNDIAENRFSRSALRSLVEGWNAILNSEDYFVRYQDAGWKLHDPKAPGIFYSRNQQPMA